MKKFILIIVLATLCPLIIITAQSDKVTIRGKIIDENALPVPGTTISVKGTDLKTSVNDDGVFVLRLVPKGSTLMITRIGYQTKVVRYTEKSDLGNIIITSSTNELKEFEVVSTGYQVLSRDKVAGSFVQIDNKLFNRSVSTNLLERIKDVVPGVYFQDRDPQTNSIARFQSNKDLGIVIRGESTLNASKQPLIILDNFPYEGEIKNINPNDVESITILKDASAASIWGAKSGNGVIVINTKKGKLNQELQVDFNANVSIIKKDDLYYGNNYLDSKTFIEIEQYLFDKGYFNAQINSGTGAAVVSPAVELMAKYKTAESDIQRAEILRELETLKSKDVRKDYSRYVYQNAVNQQYSLGIRGGKDNLTYTLSVGHDENKNSLIRNGYQRTSINSLNTYKPLKNLELTVGINYSHNKTLLNNSFRYGTEVTGFPYGSGLPYNSLIDDKGDYLPVLKGLRMSYLDQMNSKGFLDWTYRPLDEINLADNSTTVNDLLLRFNAKYQILPQLNIQLSYQNEHQMILENNYRSIETYYARNLINQFGEYDNATGNITYNFPKGGVLDTYNSEWNQNNLRGQVNYVQEFGKHELGAIVGSEIQELNNVGTGKTLYGYNDQFGISVGNLNYEKAYPINPSGSAHLPVPNASIIGIVNRNLSYYAIANYSYDGKYTVNLSARKDGANLFGAKANDKIAPFWSTGLGWRINKEKFYNLNWLPDLRFRASYGYQGNTSTISSAYLTGDYDIDPDTGAPILIIGTAPNPQLQWENTRTVSLALDFSTKNNVLTGSIELYSKKSENLIQTTPLASQTGFREYQANTASIQVNGLDVSLQSQNLKGEFRWNTILLLSTVKNKVLKYDLKRTSISSLTEGKPLDAVFSYKWAGLNPVNGNPEGYINGQKSEDYRAIINNYAVDSIVYNGSRTPTTYGAFRNDLSFKGFNLSVNLVYRLGYVFRRSSVNTNYTEIIRGGQHTDYYQSWKAPGDEAFTNVPSLLYPANNNRNVFYRDSEILVERGDHVRLQDIRLGYEFPSQLNNKFKFSTLNVFAYANNLGTIWRKNKLGFDPTKPLPFSISFGITAKL